MSVPLRLLFVVNNPAFIVSHRRSLLRAARAAGYEVRVAGPDGPGREALSEDGFPFHPVFMVRGNQGLRKEWKTARSLVRLYRDLRPDLVHHLTIKPILYGGYAARKTDVPAVVNAVTGLGYVFIAGNEVSRFGRCVISALYRRSFGHPVSTALFQNPDDRSEFVSRGLVDPARTVLIPGTGVDVNLFVPTPEPEGPPLVVLPTRMLRHKGVAEFVEAACLLRKESVAARFVLVGDEDPGNPASLPASQLEKWKAEGVVEWWGHRTDMPKVLAGSHIVCLPSYREGLPRALIEAAACARPLVAFDVPGCREIVRPMENGLLARERTASSLAGALRTLIQDPALRRKLGARGREIAVAEFSEERINRLTLEVYSRLAERIGRAAESAR
ncbi:MAG: glycosyltransferase family 4 protein [Planctomycetes bacterium]|nr:glycosyltransferase family 4 protein [Planctomycetota bacterium]